MPQSVKINPSKIKSERIHKYCLRCGRKLKNEEYRVRGYGEVCWKKMQSEKNLRKLF